MYRFRGSTYVPLSTLTPLSYTTIQCRNRFSGNQDDSKAFSKNVSCTRFIVPGRCATGTVDCWIWLPPYRPKLCQNTHLPLPRGNMGAMGLCIFGIGNKSWVNNLPPPPRFEILIDLTSGTISNAREASWASVHGFLVCICVVKRLLLQTRLWSLIRIITLKDNYPQIFDGKMALLQSFFEIVLSKKCLPVSLISYHQRKKIVKKIIGGDRY